MLNIRLREIAEREYAKAHPFKGFLRRMRGEDDGTLNVRLSRLFPGFGVPLQNDNVFLQTGLTLTEASSPQTFPIPATGVLAPTTTAGRIRIKCYNGASSITITDITVTATDGTNTVNLPQGKYHPSTPLALTSTAWLDWEFGYLLDVASSGAGGGASGQLSSVIGGANAFNVIVSTGTGGTGSMDVEICPLV